MSKMRTLIGQILTPSLFISCRNVKTIPTNPSADTPKNSGPSSISSPGVIVVRLVSFSEDVVNLAWADTDSTRISCFVERKDADTSQYVVLAELGPWVKEHSDGGIEQILYLYYLSHFGREGGKRENELRSHLALPESKTPSLCPSDSYFSRYRHAPVEFYG